MTESQFHLQNEEKVIMELKPKGIYLFQTLIVSFISLFVFLFIFLVFTMSILRNRLSSMPWTFLITGFTIMLWSFISSFLRYKQEKYWITTQRIIFRRGFIGYSITSLPLERIVDVVISRSFMQQIFGTPSLHLDTFGSGYVGGGMQNYASKGTMFAVDNPEDLQKLILELIKKKRKAEKLTI